MKKGGVNVNARFINLFIGGLDEFCITSFQTEVNNIKLQQHLSRGQFYKTKVIKKLKI